MDEITVEIQTDDKSYPDGSTVLLSKRNDRRLVKFHENILR